MAGEPFESRNPADPDEVIGTVPTADAALVDRAVAGAAEAFARWSRTSIAERAGEPCASRG